MGWDDSNETYVCDNKAYVSYTTRQKNNSHCLEMQILQILRWKNFNIKSFFNLLLLHVSLNEKKTSTIPDNNGKVILLAGQLAGKPKYYLKHCKKWHFGPSRYIYVQLYM